MRITLRIPMITGAGPLKARQMSREFQGAVPAVEEVAFVARIIRDGIEAAHYPDNQRLIALPDDWLVQQVALVTAVPDDIWIRNGLVPLGDWEPGRGD